MGRFKKAFLDVLNHTLNPLTLRAARSGRGPFSLIRHVGRKTGRTFETPVMLAEADDGLVAELTYGDSVNWYRNIVRGHGEVRHKGRTYRILTVEPFSTEAGLAAFGGPRAVILKLLRRTEFRLLRVEAMTPRSGPDGAADRPAASVPPLA